MKSGILIVDKPQGVTSHDLVAAVRARLGLRRVGHAGTLDPMATGVLVIGFGQATRLLNAIVGHDKTYEATIRLGQATDTDDADGHLLPPEPGAGERIQELSQGQIEAAIAHYTGDIEQVPNAYSAIKVHGQRAYDLARQGQAVELKARTITVSEYKLLRLTRTRAQVSLDDPSKESAEQEDASQPVIDLQVRVSCSSGTYIRALGRDLGAELGVGGHLTRLRRVRVGRFDLSNPALAARVITAHVVEHTFTDRQGQVQTRNKAMLDQDRAEIQARALGLVDGAKLTMPTLAVSSEQAQELEHGQFLPLSITEPTAAILTGTDGSEQLVGLLEPRGSHSAKPSAVFALANE
ncbi:tRNA pseudouridine synthase B [Bombiscardovia nodaiensis]|uniref:tRNA pseudouridine synthase B n=1 Tax=Bombiscardovia nodaiensis TaxID=2932181 RepID=A0ABM8B6X1_9BIFI|nr:tRNA pseudouridine synthase B [Bombiscardovia nodaiensis]